MDIREERLRVRSFLREKAEESSRARKPAITSIEATDHSLPRTYPRREPAKKQRRGIP